MKPFGGKLSALLVTGLLLHIGVSLWMFLNLHVTPRGSEMSFPRTMFTVVNAATLSGFQLPMSIGELQPLGQFLLFTLIVSSTLVMLIAGGCGVVRLMRMPYTDGQIVRSTLAFYAALVIVGTGALVSTQTGPVDARLWAALFQACSAIGNCGLVVGNSPSIEHWTTHAVLFPLALLGGLGVPVVMDLIASFLQGRRLHPHTGATLSLVATIFVVGVFLIVFFERSEETDYKSAMVMGSTEVLNNRTLGFPLESFVWLALPSQWIVFVVMLIGAAPGSSGGGLTTLALNVLFRDSFRLVRGLRVGRLLGIICFWTIFYVSVIFVAAMFLVAETPQAPGDRMLFLVTSAMGNVGTYFSPITVRGTSLYILCAVMMIGRFAPLALIWGGAWLTRDEPGTHEASPIQVSSAPGYAAR